MKTLQDAQQLLDEYVKNASLKAHCKAVGYAMQAYAQHYDLDQRDVERYTIAGMLHDFDFEKHPTLEEHPKVGVGILKEQGYDEEIQDAILGHGNHTGVPRTTQMAKTLFAVDELSGIIVALAKIRPGQFDGMTAKSVKKALKKKAFAAGVDRNDIQQGIDDLQVDADQHFQRVVDALALHAEELGVVK